jgi:hypothetical protein
MLGYNIIVHAYDWRLTTRPGSADDLRDPAPNSQMQVIAVAIAAAHMTMYHSFQLSHALSLILSLTGGVNTFPGVLAASE